MRCAIARRRPRASLRPGLALTGPVACSVILVGGGAAAQRFGIAVGATAVDVTKQAADAILLNDDLTALAAAVRLGREAGPEGIRDGARCAVS